MILLNPSPWADINYTFDDYQSTKISEQYPGAKSKEVGWFVRSVFEEDYDQRKVKKALGFNPDLPLFLLTSGSLGNVSPAKLLPMFLTSDYPSQVLMVCGSNELLKSVSEGIQKSFPGKSKTELRVEGFTNKMPQYMKAADLVIGKSGPNTLFESVATLTPFMAINYGGDQEKGNQEIIVGYNLGIVENRIDKIWPKIEEFLKDPSLLKSYKNDLEKIKKHNVKSKEILLEDLKKVIG
jgi:processive 1,2-diacylglycerol beta-glucosyltransferase